jgi:hypothetical protein
LIGVVRVISDLHCKGTTFFLIYQTFCNLFSTAKCPSVYIILKIREKYFVKIFMFFDVSEYCVQ